MAWFTRSSRCTLLAVALTLGLSVSIPVSVQAQLINSSLGSKLQNAFRPPRSSGRSGPENTVSGGTRGACMMTNKPLTALVPAFGGKTAAEYPTIFWYAPPLSAEEAPAPAVEFVLRDANNQVVYSTKYALEKAAKRVVGTPGIMSLTIAPLYPLEIGQEYRWELKVRCDGNDPEVLPALVGEGKLQRVEADPNLALRVQQATLEERVAMYADQELWYETLDALIKLRRDRPYDQNLADAWEKLLSAVGLATISEEPLFQSASNIQTNNQ